MRDGTFRSRVRARPRRSQEQQNRKRELEQGFNNISDTRHERIRAFGEVAGEFFTSYKLRLPASSVYADYAIDHLKRLLSGEMLVDFNEATRHQVSE